MIYNTRYSHFSFVRLVKFFNLGSGLVSYAKIAVLALLMFCASEIEAQTSTVFNRNHAQYRIPAIVECKSGKLLAFADNRYDNKDIGGGRRLDIVMSYSNDNGIAWSADEQVVAGGTVKDANSFDCAHGDAAVVVDSKSGRILMMCASGGIGYWESTKDHPIMMGRYYSDDEGKTWYGCDVTRQIYSLIPDVEQAFFSSGRICQSTKIKKGQYYRIYSVLATRRGNVVLYSDDFGMNWTCLGEKYLDCAPKGDEAKIVELPDGNVLLSSRVSGGRIYNIYTYSDTKKAVGEWGEPKLSSKDVNGVSASSNACNGEVLVVKVKDSNGKKKHLLLQSVPLGPQRTNVAVFFKDIPSKNISLSDITNDWEGYYQVSSITSAYSTMIQGKDGKIHFLYEEDAFRIPETQPDDYYNIVYKQLSIKQLTQNKYQVWKK